jgi:hypothetical protein
MVSLIGVMQTALAGSFMQSGHMCTMFPDRRVKLENEMTAKRKA